MKDIEKTIKEALERQDKEIGILIDVINLEKESNYKFEFAVFDSILGKYFPIRKVLKSSLAMATREDLKNKIRESLYE